MPGSASGLRVTPCISAPAAPSAAPTSSPSSVRGTRRSRTIACASLPSYAVNARTTSPNGTAREPIASEARTTQTREQAARRQPGERRA